MTINIRSHKLLLSAIAATIALSACAQAEKSNHADANTPAPSSAAPVTAAETAAPAASTQANPNVHIRQYKAADGAMLTARYDTSTTPPQVTLTLGGQNATLKQTEACAKGAVYQAGDLTWEAKGQEATLKQGKKIVKWTETQ